MLESWRLSLVVRHVLPGTTHLGSLPPVSSKDARPNSRQKRFAASRVEEYLLTVMSNGPGLDVPVSD